MTQVIEDVRTLARAYGGGPLAQRLELSEDEYHADPCPEPSLSSSIAHTLLDRSPRHAWAEHPKLGGHRRGPTRSLDRGSLLHKLVLGKGSDIRVIHADDFRTKRAREQRDAARADGAIPVLEADYEDALDAAQSIRSGMDANEIDLSGASEVTITWRERAGEHDIWARARLDHVHVERGTIYDLKTTRIAHPEHCARSVVSYGYDIQQAAYMRALAALDPTLDGRIDYVLVFAEPEPPFAVTVARLDGLLRTRGERRWERAAALWGRCLAADDWPAYSQGPVWLNAPAWVDVEESET